MTKNKVTDDMTDSEMQMVHDNIFKYVAENKSKEDNPNYPYRKYPVGQEPLLVKEGYQDLVDKVIDETGDPQYIIIMVLNDDMSKTFITVAVKDETNAKTFYNMDLKHYTEEKK